MAAIRQSPSGRWFVLVAVALASFAVIFDGVVLTIAYPRIAEDLGASLNDLQWVSNAYLLAIAPTLIVAGRLGDRYGRRRLFCLGTLIFVLTSVLCALAGAPETLIAGRALQGLGGALLLANGIGLIRAIFPLEEFDRALGTYLAVIFAVSLPSAIGGPALVDAFSWQAVFVVNLPLGLAALGLAVWLGVESRNTENAPLDVPGAAVLATSLVALVYALIDAPERGWGDARTLALLIGGVVLLGVFAFIERRTVNPVLPPRLARRGGYSGAVAAAVALSAAYYALVFFFVLYFQNVRGLSATETAVRFLPYLVPSVVAAPLGTALSHRFGSRPVATVSIMLFGVCLLPLAMLNADSSYAAVWPWLIGLGIGFGAGIASTARSILTSAPKRFASVAAGTRSTAENLGQALGAALAVALVNGVIVERLSSSLVRAGAPEEMVSQAPTLAPAVAQGVTPVPPQAPEAVAVMLREAGAEAFLSAWSDALVVLGVIAILGGLVAAAFIRPAPELETERKAPPEERPAAAVVTG
jgi:EmrB/QacA subfamily drug resistance transporter